MNDSSASSSFFIKKSVIMSAIQVLHQLVLQRRFMISQSQLLSTVHAQIFRLTFPLLALIISQSTASANSTCRL